MDCNFRTRWTTDGSLGGGHTQLLTTRGVNHFANLTDDQRQAADDVAVTLAEKEHWTADDADVARAHWAHYSAEALKLLVQAIAGHSPETHTKTRAAATQWLVENKSLPRHSALPLAVPHLQDRRFLAGGGEPQHN